MIRTFRPVYVMVSCVIVAAALVLTSVGALPARAAPRGQFSTAQLRTRLLRTADLRGWQNYHFVPNFPVWSNRPACLNAINGLDSANPPRGVTEAQAAFAESVAGPWILQTLRSYPGQGAAQAFSAATATLARCPVFYLSWNNPPEAATEIIQPRGPVRLGNQSWSAAIAVLSTISQAATLILVRVGSSTVLIEAAAPDGVPLPTFAQVTAIAARAASKLSH
jgi:hypothetical protein